MGGDALNETLFRPLTPAQDRLRLRKIRRRVEGLMKERGETLGLRGWNLLMWVRWRATKDLRKGEW
jgi:hypothetical protein